MTPRKRQDTSLKINDNNHYGSQERLVKNEDKHELSDLKGDWGNIAILFFLYLLQGIPIGLAAAVPMLLQNRGASYKQQVKISFPNNKFIDI